MAKTCGQVNDAGKVESRKVRAAKQVDFPTKTYDTRGKRIARALWG
jgi:hypothetical protein